MSSIYHEFVRRKYYEATLKAKITAAPGPIFSVRQGYRNYIRLNAASWSDEIEKALATLGGLAGDINNGSSG